MWARLLDKKIHPAILLHYCTYNRIQTFLILFKGRNLFFLTMNATHKIVWTLWLMVFSCIPSTHLNVNLRVKVWQIWLLKQQRNSQQWFREHLVCLQQHWKPLLRTIRFQHLTATSQDRVSNINPCKIEKTKSQGKDCPCTCLCVCLSALLRSHWSMQTFCPLAWQTRREQQRLLFLSVDMTNHISVKKGHKSWWQQPHRPKSKCYIMTS